MGFRTTKCFTCIFNSWAPKTKTSVPVSSGSLSVVKHIQVETSCKLNTATPFPKLNAHDANSQNSFGVSVHLTEFESHKEPAVTEAMLQYMSA